MTVAYQNAFNGGELTPLLHGQNQLDKRAVGLAYCVNMIASKQGPLIRTGGTKYITSVKDKDKRTQLIGFQYSNGDMYQIEFGDRYFRFYRNNVQIGAPYEIVTPYLQADLFNSDNVFQPHVVQSADVMYIFIKGYQTRALSRLSDTSWTLTTMAFEDGPYLDINTTTTKLTPSATTGTITLTASAVTGINNNTGFQSTDVGRVLRFRDSAVKWRWGTILSVVSTTVITITFNAALASTTNTDNWMLGTFSNTTGWPETSAFHRGRIAMGGSTTYPDRAEFSTSNGYSATSFIFDPTNEDGEVADDNGFSVTLPSNQVNRISWMISDTKGLIVGTEGEEWVIEESGTSGVLTPSSKKANPISSTGSARMPGVRADTGVLFVQNSRRRLFDIIYSFEQDRQKPRDISVFAEHITAGRIIQVGYMQEPYNLVLTLLNTGIIIMWTYDPDQKVFAATRRVIGGTDAKIESFAITKDSDGEAHEMTLITKRTINGVTERYVEYMTQPFYEGMDKEDAFQVDCGITYIGTPTLTVTGLDHLEGETVKIMIDGKSHPDRTVTSGEVTLTSEGSKIHVGLSSRWEVELLTANLPTFSKQTPLSADMRINKIKLRLINSLDFKYGVRGEELLEGIDEFTFNQGAVLTMATPLFTGNTPQLTFPGHTDTEGKVYLTSDGVFPMTIVAARIEGEVREQ